MENIEQILLVLLFGFGLSVLWLKFNDRLFTRATNRPASERQLQGIQEYPNPLSRRRYWIIQIGNLTLLFVSVYILTQVQNLSGMDRFVWLVFVFQSGASIYPLQIALRRQSVSAPAKAPPNQLSGPAR